MKGGNGVSKEEYKEKIIEMLKELENENYIKMIYGFVKGFLRNEKAGN